MPISVLLADDHPVIREGLEFILGKQKDIAVVGSANDGCKAVQQVRALRPDVVVMDIVMPNLNGIEATRQIIMDWPAVRVIILSVCATAEHIYQAFLVGAKGYLLKGSIGLEIIEAIRSVHLGCYYLSHQISGVLIDEYVIKHKNPQQKTPLESLSSREREILEQVVNGRSSATIAGILNISSKTVETYRSRAMEKLRINNLTNLVKFAIQHGMTSLE